jgi:integrase
MARPRSNKIYLYQKKGRPGWWARWTMPPELDRFFDPPKSLPEAASRAAAKDQRRYLNLHTTDKRHANEIVADLQAALTAAHKRALSHQFVDALLQTQGKSVRTLANFFADLEIREQERVARWRSLSHPADRKKKRALAPETAARLKLIRAYLSEALAVLYPGQTFNVNHFSDQPGRRPNVIEIRDWMLNTRGLGVETYAQFKSYFSGAWKKVAVPSGYADCNPWENPEMEPPDKQHTERAVLTAEQRAQILAAPSTWANNALKLCTLAGLRPSELPWLMRTSFNAEHNRYDVIQSKVGGKFKPMPNTPQVAAVIADQLKLLDKVGLGDCNWIFPRVWEKNCRGQQSHRKQVCKQLDRALLKILGTKKDRLGRPISPYTTRRTFSSVAGRLSKIDPHNVADLMGHATLDEQMTYSQIDDEALHASAVEIQKRIKGG